MTKTVLEKTLEKLNPLSFVTHLLDMCNRINVLENALEKTNQMLHSVVFQENNKAQVLAQKIQEMDQQINVLQKYKDDTQRTSSTIN